AQETPKAPELPARPTEQPQAKERSPAQEQTPPHPPSRTAAAHPAARPPVLNREEAPKETSGDPYLNLLQREMAKHKVYPALARPLGLTGTAHFLVYIDRAGRLVGLHLTQSSGSELLDKAGEQMIRETAPFPAPPSDYENNLILTLDVPFSPRE
ncbi:MAG: TonB family protein, partial [Alphaproteobacteria bacterium]|nr:TonB family protein [Alphaproteobacteria bacterium]